METFDEDFNAQLEESFQNHTNAKNLNFEEVKHRDNVNDLNFKKEKQSVPSTGTSATINEGRKQYLGNDTNSRILQVKSDEESKTTEHIIMYRQTINYFNFFGQFVGIHYSYDYDPRKLIAFWFAMSLFPFVYGSIIYTQCLHYVNGDYIRILELCAVYGMAISVLYKLN